MFLQGGCENKAVISFYLPFTNTGIPCCQDNLFAFGGWISCCEGLARGAEMSQKCSGYIKVCTEIASWVCVVRLHNCWPPSHQCKQSSWFSFLSHHCRQLSGLVCIQLGFYVSLHVIFCYCSSQAMPWNFIDGTSVSTLKISVVVILVIGNLLPFSLLVTF